MIQPLLIEWLWRWELFGPSQGTQSPVTSGYLRQRGLALPVESTLDRRLFC